MLPTGPVWLNPVPMPPCPALPSTAATLHYVFSVVQQNSAKFVRLVARCTASVDTLYSWLWLVFCLPVPWPESCCREISPKKVAQSLASSRLPGVGVGFLFSFFFIFGLFCAFLSFSQNFQKPAFLCFFFPRGRFSATPPPPGGSALLARPAGSQCGSRRRAPRPCRSPRCTAAARPSAPP